MLSSLESRVPPRAVLVLAGVAFFSIGLYLLFSGVYYHIGFPLDDAWIHQTYARNLALRGEWSFTPGHPSGGSTAPLWSALLAIGFWLKLSPFIWTYSLGVAALWMLALVGEWLVRQQIPSYRPRFPWVGVLMALEWHMVWAGASGMETLFFALLATSSLAAILSGSQKYLSLGLMIGLSSWVRPDGITLLGPAVLVIFLMQSSWSKRLQAFGLLMLGFGSLFALYLLFNLMISGSPFPNTFYAKQAEYSDFLNRSFLTRFSNEAFPALEGVGIVLLPGLVLSVISSIRRKAWGLLSAVIWFVGFLALYAWRLPVTYQYGRYIMPAMPIFFILGLAGLVEFISLKGQHWRWIISFSWRMTAGSVLIVFWVLGAIHYAQDVAVIESEMVATAKWISTNVPINALVAAHDIGALGYYGGHNLVDLAGLVSPEVIPFLRNEDRIAAYLDQRGVTYLVTFPDWYQHLSSTLLPIFTTKAPFAPALGEGNMTVYRWPPP